MSEQEKMSMGCLIDTSICAVCGKAASECEHFKRVRVPDMKRGEVCFIGEPVYVGAFPERVDVLVTKREEG